MGLGAFLIALTFRPVPASAGCAGAGVRFHMSPPVIPGRASLARTRNPFYHRVCGPMDSGFVLRTPRNDGNSILAPRKLLKALDQPLALEAGQPLDPEQAVQLVDLMLVANGAQTLRIPRSACCRGGHDS